MTRRCEPIQRRYTELCNRSGSPPLRPPHARMYPTDVAFEDYWEDSSVSLRSFHSWEAPSSPWLNVSSATVEAREESKMLSDSESRRARPCRYSFDASDHLGSMKGRRSFPPPLASCSTLSIKEGGRFVLKEMDADRPQGFFRAQRENGRLLLQLVLPDELNEEDDDGNNDGIEADAGGDEDNLSIVKCAEEEGAGICEELEYDALDGEPIRGNRADCISREEEGIKSITPDGLEEGVIANTPDGLEEGVIANDCDCACERAACGSDAHYYARPSGNGLQDVGSNVGEVSVFTTPQAVSKEELQLMHVGDMATSLHLLGSSSEDLQWDKLCPNKGGDLVETDNLINIDVKHFVAESSFGREQGVHQQEPLWNVDVGLSPWSPKQLCLHPPIVNMRPVLSLAMS